MKAEYTVVTATAKIGDSEDVDGSSDLQVYRPKSRGLLLRVVFAVLIVLLIVATVLFVVFLALYVTKSSSSSSLPPPPSPISRSSLPPPPSSSSTTSPPSSSSSRPSPTPSPSPSPPGVCQSEACLDLAVQIKGAMDPSIDPCEDFYNFTCGNWAVFNHVPEDIFGTGALQQQQFAVYSNLAEVLGTNFTGGNKVLTELWKFYNSCIVAQLMNETEFVDNFVPVIRKLYQDLGGWSLVGIPEDGAPWSVNSSQFIREKMTGSDAFYSFSIGFDEEARQYSLVIEQAGLSLEYPDLYNDTNSTDMLLYEVSLFLGELAQGPVSNVSVYNIVQFEIALAQCGMEMIHCQIWEDATFDDDDTDPNSTYTVEELYQLWPYHDWLGVLQGVFGPAGVSIKLSSNVTVGTPDYFRRLTSLVEATPTETLENYAKWIMTWQLSEVFLPDATIRESLVLFRQLVLGKPSMDQQQECVSIVEQVLPLALGRVYAQHILPPGYKEAGMTLVAGVRAGLGQRMMEVDWLDNVTRQLALEKLAAIESRVAYPNKTFDDGYLEMLYGMYTFNKAKYVENFLQFINISLRQAYSLVYKPLDRTMWFDSPTSVNAYYIAIFNQISILEAIMRIPSFNAEWPLSVQYGGLGMVLGHELTHGFDNNGRQFDKEGRRRMWWSQTAVDAFNDRAQCFVEQYSKYQLFGLPVDGNQTLGENIADNGGIRASYDAFKKVAWKSQKLPGLTDFSDDQLFFIGFSQLWCSYNTFISFYVSVLTDEHAPNPFRVIGALSNNEAFSEAFHCPAGSAMNRTDKCVLW